MEFGSIIENVSDYYSSRLKDFGTTPKGVDWNGEESQKLRFQQLLKICEGETHFSMNDIGCGFGSQYDYMVEQDLSFKYVGYDISEQMVLTGKDMHKYAANCRFTDKEQEVIQEDYSVASGIFNVRLKHSLDEWQEYVRSTIDQLADKSLKGFSFNMLTKYSDADRMRPDLYYGDPCFYFDYCMKKFGRKVALLHNYGLFEFTILVWKKI
jgi:hypothetical protein